MQVKQEGKTQGGVGLETQVDPDGPFSTPKPSGFLSHLYN